jgi:hypothetical protein
MSLTIKFTEDGTPIYPEEAAKSAKQKRCVLRNLGRIEQIIACAERLMERPEDESVQAATKNA